VRYTPILGLIACYNARTMNQYLSKVLDERYADWCTGRASRETSRSVIDILLADYMSKLKDKAPSTLDVAFKDWAIPQLRFMFFTGYSSAAATLSYAFYLISQHPLSIEKLRAEHDDVFGKDLSAASDLIRAQPQLLNRLPYTTAVIKEVLRLFPPAAASRLGRASCNIVGHDGKRYPTANVFVWVLHSVLHRDPRYWKDPSVFIPERFLVGPDDPLYPVKGAYRPFEHGPRDCIGQALAMSKLKISLVMLVRLFDVVPAYKEWDQMHVIPGSRTCRFRGERAYQVGQAGAHPADGFPARITVRE
jgi:cytochrome P450